MTGRIVLSLFNILLLRWWQLFNKDSGERVPPAVRIGITVARAVPNPKSNSDGPLVKRVTYTLDVSVVVIIGAFSTVVIIVKHCIDFSRLCALGTIEGEEPSLAAVLAVTDAKTATVENSETAVAAAFLEYAFL